MEESGGEGGLGKPNQWELVVVVDTELEAYCERGGKVVIPTGYIRLLKYDAELVATTLAHEIAHCMLRHSSETWGTGPQLEKKSMAEIVFNLGKFAYDVLLSLPLERTQELEADRLSLTLVANTGFNPEAAIEKMKILAEWGDVDKPWYLRTHPLDEQRIQHMREHLEPAMAIYRQRMASLQAADQQK